MEKLSDGTNALEMIIGGSAVRLELADGRTRPKLGYLGPLGTYTEEAVIRALGDDRDSLVAETLLRTNGEVVRKVDSGEFDLGVVAVENSTEGDVMETLRELIRAKEVTILGEVIVPISHVLIGRKNHVVRRILSHPQALGQCSEYLYTRYPQAELISTTSTADAVRQIAPMEDAAAIASRRALRDEDLGLEILAQNIGNNRHNATRFLVIGRGETRPTGEDTTTIVFYPREDRPGLLKDCLEVLALYGINLSDLKSHPTGRMRQYMFLASLQGHGQDESVRRALELLNDRFCSSLKVLGSYKTATIPEGVVEPGVINGDNGNDVTEGGAENG